MKIRQGFVSNSSSSSFVALGFSIDQEEKPYKDILIATGSTEEDIDAIIQKEKDRYAKNDWNWEEDEQSHIQDILWDKVYEMGREDNIRILYGSEDGVDSDDKVIALMLMETDDYDGGCMGQGELVCDESDEHYRRISELRDEIAPDASIRILFGTRCC